MASYLNIKSLDNDDDILNKMEVAATIAAETIRVEAVGTTNHANRLIWAKQAMEDPGSKRLGLLHAFIAANKSENNATLQGHTDAEYQTGVDASIDLFADGA